MSIKKLFKGQRFFFTLLLLVALSLNAQNTNEISVNYTPINSFTGNNTTYEASWQAVFNENGEEIADYLLTKTDSEGSTVSVALITAGDPNYFNGNTYQINDVACVNCLKIINTEKDVSVIGEFLTVIAAIDPTVIITPNETSGTVDFSEKISLEYCNKALPKNSTTTLGINSITDTDINSYMTCSQASAKNNFDISGGFSISQAIIVIREFGQSIQIDKGNNLVTCNTTSGWNLSYNYLTPKGNWMLLGDAIFNYTMPYSLLSSENSATSDILEVVVYIEGQNGNNTKMTVIEKKIFSLDKTLVQKNAFGTETQDFEMFPNPCQDYMTVNYILDTDSDVSMAVYNVLGEKVMSKNSFQQAGKNQANFDTSLLPSGTYIYRLIQNDKTILSKRFAKIE